MMAQPRLDLPHLPEPLQVRIIVPLATRTEDTHHLPAERVLTYRADPPGCADDLPPAGSEDVDPSVRPGRLIAPRPMSCPVGEG